MRKPRDYTPEQAVRTLKQHPQQQQQGVLQWLQGASQQAQAGFQQLGFRAAARVKQPTTTSFWINNSLATNATPEMLARLSERDDVEWILEIEPQEFIEPAAAEAVAQANVTWDWIACASLRYGLKAIRAKAS